MIKTSYSIYKVAEFAERQVDILGKEYASKIINNIDDSDALLKELEDKLDLVTEFLDFALDNLDKKRNFKTYDDYYRWCCKEIANEKNTT